MNDPNAYLTGAGWSINEAYLWIDPLDSESHALLFSTAIEIQKARDLAERSPTPRAGSPLLLQPGDSKRLSDAVENTVNTFFATATRYLFTNPIGGITGGCLVDVVKAEVRKVGDAVERWVARKSRP